MWRTSMLVRNPAIAQQRQKLRPTQSQQHQRRGSYPPEYLSNFLGGQHNFCAILFCRTLEGNLPPEVIKLEKLTRLFTARTHWELSTTLTSNHLLAIIALANTLMSMNNATFVPEQERNRRLHRYPTWILPHSLILVYHFHNIFIMHYRQNTVTAWNFQNKVQSEESEELYTAQQAQIKQGWSLLATLHCVLLPDKVELKGSKNFKRPQVEMMARRWQHHCLEVSSKAMKLSYLIFSKVMNYILFSVDSRSCTSTSFGRVGKVRAQGAEKIGWRLVSVFTQVRNARSTAANSS